MINFQHLQQTLFVLRLELGLFTVREALWFLTLGFALYAGWLDLRTRRIPNWLTVGGFCVGLLANTILGGWHGILLSLEGAGLGLILLLPLVLLRAMGAGDWKLMGAMGALLGWKVMFLVLLAGFFISSVMGLVQVAFTGRLGRTFRNMYRLVMGFFIFGLRANPEISLDNPTAVKLPFGTAVAVATALIFVANYWATNWQF